MPCAPFAGHSLMCYTCQGETSNKYCMQISMCAKEDRYCVTIKDVVGAGTPIEGTGAAERQPGDRQRQQVLTPCQ
uniref:Snake toxin/toxin-like domain-containing protein n=1 Tax=Chelydra serpentina TaxID=8475 RepID=A0A8C3SY98_CHESE